MSRTHQLGSASNPNAEEPGRSSTNLGQSLSAILSETQRFDDREFRAPFQNCFNESIRLPPRKMARFSQMDSMDSLIRYNQLTNINQSNFSQALSHPITFRDVEEPIITPDKVFEIFLDVHDFKPEELKVKLVDDFIIIYGEHGERMDGDALVSQQFTRRYEIPEELDKGKIASFISSDGILCIFGPKSLKVDKEIPIIPVNRPTKSMDFKVSEKKLHQSVTDQSEMKQSSQDATKAQAVEESESISPQLGVIPETMELEHVPEQNNN